MVSIPVSTLDLVPGLAINGGLAEQADGGFYLAGATSTPVFVNFQSQYNRAFLVHYLPSGQPDTAFGTNGYVVFNFANADKTWDDYVTSIRIQPDGKILVAGSSNGFPSLARFLPNGEFDNSFGTNGIVTDATSDGRGVRWGSFNYEIATLADGSILVGSVLWNLTTPQIVFRHYSSTGQLDNSFSTNSLLATGIQGENWFFQPDGKLIVIAGDRHFIERFNLDGSLDNSFGINGKVQISANVNTLFDVVFQPDGKLLITCSQDNALTLFRLNANGTVDSTFGTNGSVFITDKQDSRDGIDGVAVADSGSIYALDFELGLLFKLTSQGQLDQTFDGDGILQTGHAKGVDFSGLRLLSVHADGNVILAGTENGNIITAVQNFEFGNAANDWLQTTASNDILDGGAGLDTAIYGGIRAEYTLARTSSGMTAFSASEGTDTLVSIERLQFTDETIAFDLDGNAGQVYRLYQAAFNRVPDQAGLGDWIDGMDHGMGLSQVATGFINSAEFKSLYGNNPSDSAFVTLLYDNVLHRAPDAGGYAYWMNELAHGVNREQALIGFSESTENKVALMAFDMDGNMGKDYRLYQAAFDRKPDVSGLDYWYHQLNSGVTLQQVASGFINSAEFKALYGSNPTNAEFVTLLYNNVLHRAPDTTGYNDWMNGLAQGMSRADMLIGFSESLENQLSLVGIVQTGIEFV